MTKIDIISGFLGAGKTTLIKKLLSEALAGQKIVLIENEFGEIGIDGGFLKEAGIEITEMNSGCICCSLVGDFSTALKKVLLEYSPDRVIIEPSGVGKLSDVIRAVQGIDDAEISLNSFSAVVDASKCKIYMKNFGEFFNNQIESAQTVILSRTQKLSDAKLAECVDMIKQHNPNAKIVTTPWDDLNGEQILAVMEKQGSLADELLKEEDICPTCGHHHDHHHEHGHDECHHDHHHEHGHDECCHDHHHEHGHHHHHADDVFTSWGAETANKYTEEDVSAALSALGNSDKYGIVLRAKGILPGANGEWIHFDYVPDEQNIRTGAADYTGLLCVIGSELKEQALSELFGL